MIIPDASLSSRSASFFEDWNVFNYIRGDCEYTDAISGDDIEVMEGPVKPTSEHSKFALSALGSVTNEEILEAARFPEMISYDTTCKTNAYSYKLAYVIGTNSEWTNINFLTTILKREQKKHFSFVFNLCLPFIYGKAVLEGCTLVLSDGDPTLIGVINNTVASGSLPNAYRRRCYYHLANKTFDDEYGRWRAKDGGVGDKVRQSVHDIMFYAESTTEFQQKWDKLKDWLINQPINSSFTL